MINRLAIAAGSDAAYVDHARLPALIKTGKLPSSVLPAAVPPSIVVETVPAVTSHQVMDAAISKGASISQLSVPVYGIGSEGKTRRVDGMDMIKDYEPIYSDLSHLRSVTSEVSKWIKDYDSLLESKSSAMPLIQSIEKQDLNKVTMQRFRPPGWFIHAPFSPTIKTTPYGEEFLSSLRCVLKRYAAALGPFIKTSEMDLMLMDYDPPDTNTGMPTLSSGDQTLPARIATLKAMDFDSSLTPKQVLDKMSVLGVQLGLPDDLFFGSYLATRHGPTRKALPLWTRSVGGYSYNATAIGLYDRTRYVYPISYPLNLLTSPAYMAFKTARQRIPGLWHDPASLSAYVAKLRTQGKLPYSIDFSGMDTTMPPHLIKLICAEAASLGFPKFALGLLSEATDRAQVIMPSFVGDNNSVTVFSGLVGWLSGYKLTSEMDTIFGATTLLTILAQQIPDIREQWSRGSFTFAELGDDIIFTTNSEIDTERMIKDATSLAGADLKVLKDAMFLKMMLPLSPEIPKLTKPFSRIVQQTFYNEDRYSGIKGGAKPGAIMRLALMSRCAMLHTHPLFKDVWPPLFEIVKTLKYVDEASQPYRNRLSQGVFSLDSGDEVEIQKYAISNAAEMIKWNERAKYEPSAAMYLSLVSQFASTDDAVYQALAQRRAFVKALYAAPEPNDIKVLKSFMSWLH